ncbi:type IV secretory system conjugative DNA transfer family protein [Streptomyces sp. CC210A]|uniref:type IV secretory system conjugative DNA transfer family protein n=1 Tax=Streptomyces sp. CC210A TaxID=2898184 RepID=UPI001F25B40A|nr:type IV secretory system conjugative DNA transfer family protein [Streptomyces sp. CC210A]
MARGTLPPAPGPGTGPGGERGIPDGLLVGALGVLLGATLLVWTATGLSALFSHGAWPSGVTFTRTPPAMRSLLTDPRDLAAAWPATPPGDLASHGVFWGVLVSEFLVLVVLAVFVLGTLARRRAVRAAARRRHSDQSPQPQEYGHPAPPAPPHTRGRPPGLRKHPARDHETPGHGTRNDRRPKPRTHDHAAPSHHGHPRRAGDPRTHDLAAHDHPARHPSVGESAAPEPADQEPALQEHGDHSPASPDPAPRHTAGTAPAPGPVPPPRARTHPLSDHEPLTGAPVPGLLYGDRGIRRHSALRAVREAAGPVLVVTSAPSVWADSKDARAKLGPVLLYDPGHLCDSPSRLRWSPVSGCEDTSEAAARATALLAPVRPRARIDAAVADTAETLLRCWLHAAAVDGRPFKQVHRWAHQHSTAHEPVRILRTHPKATHSHAGLLESALTAHPERRDAARALTARALSALASVHLRDACTPHRTDALTLESFIREAGTLYLVGEPIEDPRRDPGAMPLLTALAAHVVEHGRRMAARSSDGRLDPPLTLVLEDVAAVAPLPHLPGLLATGHDLGLPTLALLRSPEQARAHWPRPLTAADR